MRAQAHVFASVSTNRTNTWTRARRVCEAHQAASSSMLKRVNRAYMYAFRGFVYVCFHICVCMRAGIQFVLLSTYDFDKNAVCTICRTVEEKEELKRRPI